MTQPNTEPTAHLSQDDPTRAFARALFGTEQTTDETEDAGETGDETGKPTGNYVPNEGNIPESKDDSDLALIRALFDN